MEKQSVFERLAKRFSECRKEIKRDKVISDGDIPNVMDTAGKALFKAISLKAIDLGDTPDWFRNKPEGTRTGYDGNELVYYSWDLYWLYTIKWLAKNRLDSGITFPGGILRVPVEESLHSGHDITDHLMGLLRLRGEHLKEAWRRLAKASEDACSYLASNDVRAEKPSEKEQNAPLGRWRIIGWIVEGIIILALLIILSYFFGLVTGIFVLAAMFTIFHLLGWLDRIKAFIDKIQSHK